MNDDQKCPNLDGCPMFQYFREYAKDVYQRLYCFGDYANTCLRFKLKQEGKPVPPDLLPFGGTLHLTKK